MVVFNMYPQYCSWRGAPCCKESKHGLAALVPAESTVLVVKQLYSAVTVLSVLMNAHQVANVVCAYHDATAIILWWINS